MAKLNTEVSETHLNAENNEYAHMSLAIVEFSPSQKSSTIEEVFKLAPEIEKKVIQHQIDEPTSDYSVRLLTDRLSLRPNTDFYFRAPAPGIYQEITVTAKPDYPEETETVIKIETPKGIEYPEKAIVSLSGLQFWCPMDSYEAELYAELQQYHPYIDFLVHQVLSLDEAMAAQKSRMGVNPKGQGF